MVRDAKKTELIELSKILANSFYDYEWSQHTFPETSSRSQKLRKFYQILLLMGYRAGKVQVLGEDPRGVAIWTKKGPQSGGLFFQIWSGLWRVVLHFSPDVVRSMKAESDYLESVRHQTVSSNHFYLDIIAIAPEHQNKGELKKLIQPLMDQADLEKRPVFLETYTINNVKIYQKYGFSLVEEGSATASSPKVWFMLRQPTTPQQRPAPTGCPEL